MPLADDMNTLRKQVLVCTLCPLYQGRKLAVPGEGPLDARIMCIGEAPGFNENEQGKPFVGQAGKFLDELLNAAGVRREEVFITNVVKCRPPGNRDPEPNELHTCIGTYLERQIDMINPEIIVTLGRYSMAYFLEDARIGAVHGRRHDVNGRTIITMYHPAAALHRPDLRDVLINDFAHMGSMLKTAEPKPAQTTEKTAPINNECETRQLSLF